MLSTLGIVWWFRCDIVLAYICVLIDFGYQFSAFSANAHADFTLVKFSCKFIGSFHTHTHTHSMIKKYGRESVERTEFSFVCKVDRNFNAFSYHLRLACRTLFTYSICIPEYHVETILLQCQYTIPIPMPILIFESLYLISNSHQLIWQMYNANIELDFWPFESRFVDYYEQYSSECLMDFIISVTLTSKYGIYRCFFFFVFINTEIDASLHAIQSRHMCL